ncbi:DUF2256 domain-containing protein [Jatrophihabitans fulvus]
MSEHPSKTCASCGRRIEWRKKWERTWDEVRYCSQACRTRGLTDADRELERSIRARLTRRPVALADIGDEDEPLRRAARRLVAQGEAELVQRGRVVDPSTARGPLQVRRA